MGDFNIVKASDGESALKNAKARRPDLIILDVMMPNKSGFQVFDELKQDEMTASVPVIMLTGVSGETGLKFSGQDMGEYFGKEPFAFIEKPVDPARVQKAVASALGG
jgi:CheY-like chemotaxis protein